MQKWENAYEIRWLILNLSFRRNRNKEMYNETWNDFYKVAFQREGRVEQNVRNPQGL